jgi:energy-coupling factor transport system ATP-binding protein
MIETLNLSYSYDNEDESRQVLENVNISINKGEFVAILGHNGSGKSTLVKSFNAVILPSGGKVYVDKMDTTDENLTFEIRKKAGMVFQNPDNQIVATIVEEDIAFGPENLGIPTEKIRKRVDDALKTVDMYAYKDHAPHMLSGGQKQRIAIAGVLAMEPEYMIFDEATAMLDPVGRKEILNTIINLNKQKNITVIMITHYMEEAIKADRVVVLNKGKVALDGKPYEVFNNVEEMNSLKLGVPQSTELMHELEKRGMKFSKTVLTAEEFVEEFEKVNK